MMKKTKPSKKEAKLSLINFYVRDVKPTLKSIPDFTKIDITASEAVKLFLEWANDILDNPESQKVWVRFNDTFVKYFIGVKLELYEIGKDPIVISSCKKEDRISCLEKRIIVLEKALKLNCKYMK